MDSLFEDWLQANESWSESTLVLNSMSSDKQKKLGKYVMRPFKAVKEQYGKALAERMLTRKREQQASKKPSEPNWIEAHPELPDELDWVRGGAQYVNTIIYRCIFIYIACMHACLSTYT